MAEIEEKIRKNIINQSDIFEYNFHSSQVRNLLYYPENIYFINSFKLSEDLFKVHYLIS
jgi:hypothetical protein